MKKYSEFQKKERVLRGIFDIFLVVLGSFVLAAADIVFLVPSNLITGGLYSIGVTVQYFIDEAGVNFQVHDIITTGLQVILFIIGLIFLGKKFSAHTLLSTIVYPGFYALLSRTNFGSVISEQLINMSEPMLGTFLAGIFGGLGVGLGVALTFLGNGSTGGIDILAMIVAKFTKIKVGISTFIFDGSIIFVCAILMRERANIVPVTLIGILSAILAAGMVEVIYVLVDNYIVVEIISDKYEEINNYIQTALDRGASIIEIEGGYTGNKHKLIKSVLNKNEATLVKDFVASVDEKAFIIFLNAKAINGEGFSPLKMSRRWKLISESNQKDERRVSDNEQK